MIWNNLLFSKLFGKIGAVSHLKKNILQVLVYFYYMGLCQLPTVSYAVNVNTIKPINFIVNYVIQWEYIATTRTSIYPYHIADRNVFMFCGSSIQFQMLSQGLDSNELL